MGNNLSLLETIFSVKNVARRHKQLCILGLKLKLKRPYYNKHLYENLPIKQNKIILESCLGAYNCNPKYIVEEILKRDLPYDIVWAVDKKTNKDSFPKQVRIIDKGSREYFKECATAKIWISNERIKQCVKKGLYKRAEQIYINTWHGSLGGKKCTIDRGTLPFETLEPYMIEAEKVDYLISNSVYEDSFLKRMFWDKGTVLRLGHARNDIFFNTVLQQKAKEKLYSVYNIPTTSKIALYAPTFRDDKDMNCYTLDYETLKNSLMKKYGGHWIILVRLHPQLFKIKDQFIVDKSIINVTDYPDMQELLVLADTLVTDYSSCIFDFMLTRKPAFIFATDIEKYNNTRGLYDSLETTPFSVATNNSELATIITKFDYKKYSNRVEKFLKDKGCMEDGHAAKKVVDLIEEIIKNEYHTK